MEKQTKLYRSILGVVAATVLLLMVPLVAMQFTDDVVWSATDFIAAGALLFSTGLAFVLAIGLRNNIIYRAAMTLAIGATFFMIWANLAVGLIGSGPNLANLMYIAIVAIAIIGSVNSRFHPNGMERTMYVTVFALTLVAIIELIANMDEYSGSSVTEIIMVNAFFSALFTISGLLFRVAARSESHEGSKN
jgi:hypothetical protein